MFRHLLFHPTTSIVNPNIGGKLHTTSSFNDFGMHSELEAEEIFTSSPAAMSTSPGPQSPTGALGGAAEVLSGPGSKSLQLGPGGAVVGGSNPSAKASAAPDVRDPLYPMRNPRAKNQLNHIHDSPTGEGTLKGLDCGLAQAMS